MRSRVVVIAVVSAATAVASEASATPGQHDCGADGGGDRNRCLKVR